MNGARPSGLVNGFIEAWQKGFCLLLLARDKMFFVRASDAPHLLFARCISLPRAGGAAQGFLG
jgi:hypothetical protein